jgi:hypothetical protein
MSILQAFIAGKEARRQADAAEQVNRMQQFLQANGQAIFQGDQNALGQLAGFGAEGLNAAMGLREAQDQRAAMEAERARAGVVDQREDHAWQMKLEEYAASKTAAERAAEAAEIEEGVKVALSARTPEEFDRIVTENGIPEFAGRFEERNQLAARFMSVADILKQNAAPEPLSPEGKLARDIEAGIVQPQAAGGADNQTERDIALLGEIGIPREEAIRITQLYVVSRDPDTGEQILIDKRTGRPVEVPAQAVQPAPQAVQPAPLQPAPAAPETPRFTFGEQYQNAPSVFGMEGMLKRGANVVSDVVPGIGTMFPVEQQSLNDFRVLGEQLVNDIASAYPRQPPSWLLQNIAELTPKPGSVWEGPDSAAAKLRSLGASMQGELRVAETQLGTRISPTMRQELEMRKIGIEAALNRIQTALTALDPQAGGNVAPEDLDLMNQLLGGN